MKREFINYIDSEEDSCECDNCDEIKPCVHFNLIRTAYILCEDCVKILSDSFKDDIMEMI